MKLFISHAEKDIPYVQPFVDLLYHIGLDKNNIFCSSFPDLGIPLCENIFDYLRNLIDDDSVTPLFMLSKNYYSSAACLNEMGAVWMKQKNYYTFMLPGFEFTQIKGAIDPSKRAIKLDTELQHLKGDLNSFKDDLNKIFKLDINSTYWERERDTFISRLSEANECIKNQSPDYVIDMSECEGCCINYINHGGCIVNKKLSANKVEAIMDFNSTEASLCSLVFFIGSLDMHQQMSENKHLQFKIKNNRRHSSSISRNTLVFT